MSEPDYFQFMRSVTRLYAEEFEPEFPAQEMRGISPLPTEEFDPDKAYDEKRTRLMEQFEIDRQREAENDRILEDDE